MQTITQATSKYGINEWIVRTIYASGRVVDRNTSGVEVEPDSPPESIARAMYAAIRPDHRRKGRTLTQIVERVEDRRFAGGYRIERVRTVDHVVRVELLHDYAVVEAKGCDAEQAQRIIMTAYIYTPEPERGGPQATIRARPACFAKPSASRKKMTHSTIEIVGGRWDGLKMGLDRPMPASDGERLSVLACDSERLDTLAGNETMQPVVQLALMIKGRGKAVEL